MKLKFYLCSFFLLMSGALFLNAQDQKEGESGETVFSASKKSEKTVDAPASVTIIGSKTIDNRPTNNVTQLLSNVVGLTFDKQGANRYNITLRDRAGVFNTSTVVMLDNRQISTIGVNVFDAANSNLSGLDLEKIEIVRGGSGSSIYGAYSNSGVIHFISKDPFKYPGTSVELSSGGLGNEESMLGKGNWDIFQASLRHAAANDDGTFGYKINARYSENGEFEIDEATSLQTGGQLLDKANGYNVDATLYFRPSSGLEFTAQAGITGREGISWNEFYAEAFESNQDHFFNFRMKNGNLTAQYSYSQSDSPFEGEDQGYYYRTNNQFKNTVDYTQNHILVQYDLSLDQLNTTLNVGVESKSIKLNSNWPDDASQDTQDRGGFMGRNDNSEMRFYGTYFQSNSALSDNVNLILSGRYDQYTNLNEGAFSPRAALVIKPNDYSSFRLSASQSTLSSSAGTMFMDNTFSGWGFPRNSVMGNSTQQTFNNPYVTWLVPGFDQIAAGNPVYYQGLGLDTFSIFLGLNASGALAQLLNNSLVGLFLDVPAFLNSGVLANLLVANNQIIPVDLVGNNTELNPTDTATIATETTYEIGYKAELKRFKIGVDIYRATKENFSAVQQISPFASLPVSEAATIDALFSAVFANAMGGGFIGAFLGDVMGGAFAQAYAQQLAGFPFGIVNSDQSIQRGSMNFGYINYGEIEYYGTDVSTEFMATDDLSLYANYSWLSQNWFEGEDLGEPETSGRQYSLNTPKHRVKAGLTYYPSSGFTGGLSMRYQNSFTAQQGFYGGFVPKRTVWDAHLGYKFSKKTQLNVNVSNLLGKKYRVYNGMPEIGTSAVASLRYNF